MSTATFKVKSTQTALPAKSNSTTQSTTAIMSFLDDSKNVDFQYSSIPSQRETKPKAGFSVSKTNGSLVDYM